MSTFKDRLIEERILLDDKITRLSAFMTSESFGGIDPLQQALLNIQVNAMLTYSQCLIERLNKL